MVDPRHKTDEQLVETVQLNPNKYEREAAAREAIRRSKKDDDRIKDRLKKGKR